MVIIDTLTEFDTMIFEFIQSMQGDFPLLDSIFMFVAEYSQIFMAVILLLGTTIALIINNRKAKSGLNFYSRSTLWVQTVKILGAILVIVVLPMILSDLLRDVVLRDRPYVALDLEPMIEQTVRPSLPSNHTTASFAIAGFYLVYLRRGFPLIALIAALVGISRIYTGIHYPLDILIGAALGLSPAILYTFIHSYFTRSSGKYIDRHRQKW